MSQEIFNHFLRRWKKKEELQVPLFLNTGGYTKTQNKIGFGNDEKTIENIEFCRVLRKFIKLEFK